MGGMGVCCCWGSMADTRSCYNSCTKVKVKSWTSSNKKELVSHSQCSLRENPKFLQNFTSKNNTLKENIWKYFYLISAIVIPAWNSQVKTITLLDKIVCIS
jgi:hypothetical protein